MSRVTRRDFLRSAAAGAPVAYFASSQLALADTSPNDRPQVGCIGLGVMGPWDAREHAKYGDIVAVCDVDSSRAAAARDDKTIGKGKADQYGDYRKVLERKDIDVVSVVTPEHWHVKIAIEALQAGKHVFCQKPLTLTIAESQLIRAACHKHDKQVFFVGTQQRSDAERFLRAINMVQKGLLGQITKITVGINGGDVGGPFPIVPVPKELDWDFWQGQTPAVGYRKERCHYQFRWWYEYSGGKFTDWGAHHIDIASWAMGYTAPGAGPTEIDGRDAKHPVPFRDGYPTVDDCYNTAHDFAVKCKYPDGVELIVTSRGRNGVLFEGTKGRIFVDRGQITGKPIEEQWDKGKFEHDDLVQLYKGKPFEPHKANFYRCIREGGLPVSDVFTHVQMLNTCHLCAIAARFGRVIHWDAKAEQIVGDDQAAALFSRAQRKGFDLPKV